MKKAEILATIQNERAAAHIQYMENRMERETLEQHGGNNETVEKLHQREIRAHAIWKNLEFMLLKIDGTVSPTETEKEVYNRFIATR